MAFKPDVEDLRESPAMAIALTILMHGLDLVAVEPNIRVHATVPLQQLDVAIAKTDIIVILVNHRQFRGSLDLLAGKKALDDCGAFRR